MTGVISSALTSPSRNSFFFSWPLNQDCLQSNRNLNGQESGAHNNCFTLLWRAKSSGICLSLFGLTVLCLASIFRSYRRSNIWVTLLARTFIVFPSEVHFHCCFFARFWFWDLGGFSLRLFICEMAMAALSHFAETKLYQFNLWRIHFTFLSGWKSQVGLPANTVKTSMVWRDGTWHAYMQERPQNNLPSWSRSDEIMKVKDSKVFLPVVEPRSEAPQIWLFQFPRYPCEALSFLFENSPDLNETNCLQSKSQYGSIPF